MTTKSDIDRMLDILESFRDSVPGHVRQLLRLLAARCDEVEATLLAVEHGLAYRFTKVEARLKAVVDQVAEDIEDLQDGMAVMDHQLAKVEGKDISPLTIAEVEKQVFGIGPTDEERKVGEQDAMEALATAKDKHDEEGSFW